MRRLQIEAMAQIGGILVLLCPIPKLLDLLPRIENFRFRKWCSGDTLVIQYDYWRQLNALLQK
jgi:hypothetical protein